MKSDHFYGEEEMAEPVSPMGQYLTSNVLSLSNVVVLEGEVLIDESRAITSVQDVFLHINPRFSSIMVQNRNGGNTWKRVNVNIKNHIKIPTFPEVENPPHLYDEHLNNYLSRLATSQFQQGQPLWEIHIIKYPTTAAVSHLIFKLHHALGDGYSLMGALLSCLQRADNASLPLTFPSLKSNLENENNSGFLHSGFWRAVEHVPRVLSRVYNTLCDFGWDVMKSNVLEDDISPIRSGIDGVEFSLIVITTVTFSLNSIKEIKLKLKVTVNDVITGVIFYGCRLYMTQTSIESRNAHSTALVLFNTRNIAGYKSVTEMVQPNSQKLWGNNIACSNIMIPKLSDEKMNPLKFIHEVHKLMKRKKTSGAVYLTSRFLDTLRKLRGPEVAAKYIHRTLKNSSTSISNVIGPVDKLALDFLPVKSFYFFTAGAPQSLGISMISYAGNLRITFITEKDFIDSEKFKSCIEDAFDIMYKAAQQ